MAVRYDLDSRFTTTAAIQPQTVSSNTTVTSAAIDTTAYPPGVRLMIIAAVGSRTDGTYTFSVTESATSGGSYTSVTPISGAFSAISAASTTQAVTHLTSTGKPFIKVAVTSTSVTTGAQVSAFVVAVPPAQV